MGSSKELASILMLAFLLLHAEIAEPQGFEFETNMISTYRAISRGEATKALLHYESRAVEFENLAKSSDSPRPYLEEASRFYRQAAASANYLGHLQKAVDYAERALVLAEKLEDPRLNLTALSTLVGAHRRTRNFEKMPSLIERGFSRARKFPAGSANWLWWHGVFHLHRGRDFRQRGEYQEAARDFEEVIRLKTEFLNGVSALDRRAQERREHARIGIVERGVGGVAKGKTVSYALSDGKTIQKVTDVVAGSGAVVRAISFEHR
jgi:tetratricopeptide (TPR) repeat protein